LSDRKGKERQWRGSKKNLTAVANFILQIQMNNKERKCTVKQPVVKQIIPERQRKNLRCHCFAFGSD